MDTLMGGSDEVKMVEITKCLKSLVRKGGIEPPRVLPHRILNTEHPLTSRHLNPPHLIKSSCCHPGHNVKLGHPISSWTPGGHFTNALLQYRKTVCWGADGVT